MRILFIGDVVGRVRPGGSGGGAAPAARRPAHRPGGGERRERLARVRPRPRHGGGAVRRGGGRDHAGQPRLGPQGDHPVHRRPPAAAAAAELSARHAGQRARSWWRWPAGAARWWCRRWGGCYMDALDCPFRGMAAELSRYRLGGPPGSYGLAAILVDFHAEASQREDGVRAFPRRQGVGGGRHPHALPLGGRAGAAGRHGVPVGCRHVGRLRQRDRHGEGAAPRCASGPR